ncbi:hypothetical protein [Methylobacterium sp. Leaf108]|uniref:hypothetical protein n=1 Tax=Methylobacterium sp. Leaf108 TaxID=1736256 RepID=UPI000AFF2869|nr:hypothetical protein [Methylobacterium sp. Leaf108]
MSPEELLALDAMPTPGQTTPPPAAPKAPGEMTPADLEALMDAAPATTPAPAPAAPSGASTMSPAELLALDAAPAAPLQAPTPAPAPAAPAAPLPTVNGNELDAAGQVGAAILTGAAKSIYETKDFIFGKPETKSETRQSVEKLDKELGESSIANSFVSGLSQFATGMLGAGKIVGAAKLVPGVGGAVGALEATKAGATVLSSGKAAAVGAVAFDPNGPRLSDLVQKFPALQNPVTEFLASAPGDSAALGRAKNALESIGVDAAVGAVFAASMAGFKALRSGDQAAVAASQAELAHAVAFKDAKLAASKGDLEAVERLRADQPEAVALVEAETLAKVQPEVPPAAPGADITVKPDGTAEMQLPEMAVRGADEMPAGSTTEPTFPARPEMLKVSDEQVSRLIAHSIADTEQLLSPGGWEGALERGYRFGDGGRIPWQKFALEADQMPGTSPLDQVIRRVSDEFATEIAAAKGGYAQGVRSDAMQDRMVRQRVALYGDDPEALMGAIELAGRDADGLVANVAAADLITLRAATDAKNLADRIKLGMLEEFGGDLSAAMKALRAHYQVAATARAHGSAIVANAARTLRRQRADFAYSLEDVAAMGRLSDTKMLALIDGAGRDPRVADRLLRRGFWSRVQDDASFLYVNNLLWGLRTHFVNFATNAYMLGGRPLERMIGGAIQGDRVRVAENAKQYAYMAASVHEAWRDAVRTWTTGDSILSPQASELSAASASRSVNWVAEDFKQWDSTANVLSNAYTGFMKAAGLPTRALGTVDELVKQTVYRSKVMSAAHAEGIVAGLEGPALTEHVTKTLHAAFDDAGRAVDVKALEEASIATFQQDLLPGTLGSLVQTGTNTIPAMRFIIPFVRTPTNVLRLGWKMTPGLNMLQGEYRAMIRGEMGAEKQAQAIGQFAMGSLFMGTAAMLTHAGRITGGGPLDPQLRKDLMATGWQPYSFVVPGTDGVPTYVNFGRFDPVAMPLGIMADVVDILERDQDGDGAGERAAQALGGVFLSLVKQLGQKTYLTSLNETLQAITSPERGMAKTAGGMAANFVPFASGLRFVNPDPHMRETRGIVDKIMATVPGLSETLPAKRDLFGDPLTVHKGLWVHGAGGLVDAEVRRMIDEAGVGPFGPPSPRQREVDLREVTMKDGRNAYDAFQHLAGHPPRGPSMKETLAKIMATKAYQKAPDGEPKTKGTKAAMLTGTVSKYREAAWRQMMADPKVREAVSRQNMKARGAVAGRDGAGTGGGAEASALGQLGKAFGVGLGD